MTRPIDAAAFLETLRTRLGTGAVSEADDDPRTSSHVSGRSIGRPLAWVRPTTTDEVAAIISLANTHGVQVVPVGAATTFWDGLRVGDALVLDTCALATRVDIDPRARTAFAGAGTSVRAIDLAARAHGLVVASRPDAAGDTPIGSLYAVGSTSGLGMGHGLAIEQITAVTAVTGAGAIVRLGASHLLHGRPDCAHGLPNALGLLASAEGRGAVVTEVGLLLRPAPYIATVRVSRMVDALPSAPDLERLLAIARMHLDARALDSFRVEVGFDEARSNGRLEVMARVFSDADLATATRSASRVAELLSAHGGDAPSIEVEPGAARRGETPEYEYHWSFPVAEHRRRLEGGGFWGLEATVSWGTGLGAAVERLAGVFDALASVAPRHRRFAIYPGHHIVSIGVQALVPREQGAIAQAIAILESAHDDVLRVGVPYRRGFLWEAAMARTLAAPSRAPTQRTVDALFGALDPRGTISAPGASRNREGAS